MAVFVIFTGRDGQYYWRLKAPNGEIIAQSEGYVSRQGAVNGIDACKRHAATAAVQ